MRFIHHAAVSFRAVVFLSFFGLLCCPQISRSEDLHQSTFTTKELKQLGFVKKCISDITDVIEKNGLSGDQLLFRDSELKQLDAFRDSIVRLAAFYEASQSNIHMHARKIEELKSASALMAGDIEQQDNAIVELQKLDIQSVNRNIGKIAEFIDIIMDNMAVISNKIEKDLQSIKEMRQELK